jgi:hypothetical protein
MLTCCIHASKQSVMATDICDPDLKKLRNSRWDRAFNQARDDKEGESEKAANDRKATIVIEHLIQVRLMCSSFCVLFVSWLLTKGTNIFLAIANRRLMWLTQCSTGKFIESGMNGGSSINYI